MKLMQPALRLIEEDRRGQCKLCLTSKDCDADAISVMILCSDSSGLAVRLVAEEPRRNLFVGDEGECTPWLEAAEALLQRRARTPVEEVADREWATQMLQEAGVARPDCKGTGEYVGFTAREPCQTCHGKGTM